MKKRLQFREMMMINIWTSNCHAVVRLSSFSVLEMVGVCFCLFLFFLQMHCSNFEGNDYTTMQQKFHQVLTICNTVDFHIQPNLSFALDTLDCPGFT